MLVTSIFFFSHSVFCSIKEKNRQFSNFQFVVCKCFQFGHVQKFVFLVKGSTHFSVGMTHIHFIQKTMVATVTLLCPSMNSSRGTCGTSLVGSTNRIVGGAVAQHGEFPWQVK